MLRTSAIAGDLESPPAPNENSDDSLPGIPIEEVDSNLFFRIPHLIFGIPGVGFPLSRIRFLCMPILMVYSQAGVSAVILLGIGLPLYATLVYTVLGGIILSLESYTRLFMVESKVTVRALIGEEQKYKYKKMRDSQLMMQYTGVSVFALAFYMIVDPMLQDSETRTIGIIGVTGFMIFFFIYVPYMVFIECAFIKFTEQILEDIEDYVEEILKVLLDPDMSSLHASKQLGKLHESRGSKISHAIATVWGPQVSIGLVAIIVCNGGFGAVMFLVPATGRSYAPEIVKPMIAAVLVMMTIPTIKVLIDKAAVPHKKFSRITTVLSNAHNMHLASSKFRGGYVEVVAWFENQDISLRVFGVGVDGDLSGKVVAIMSSLFSIVALFLLETRGSEIFS